MSESVPAVLFDVDGTLVDTNYLHAVTWWEAFAQAGFQVPMTAIHRAIGMGSDQLLEALLPPDRDREKDARTSDAHSAIYSTYWSRLKALEGAADLLRACKKHGLRVVLASSADESQFQVLRAALAAEDAIDAATSSADVEDAKPAPDLVQVALDKACTDPDHAVFVGDTVWDVRACQRAGVRCVGLLSGGISADELSRAGAVAIYDSPAGLLGSFSSSPLGELVRG